MENINQRVIGYNGQNEQAATSMVKNLGSARHSIVAETAFKSAYGQVKDIDDPVRAVETFVRKYMDGCAMISKPCVILPLQESDLEVGVPSGTTDPKDSLKRIYSSAWSAIKQLKENGDTPQSISAAAGLFQKVLQLVSQSTRAPQQNSPAIPQANFNLANWDSFVNPIDKDPNSVTDVDKLK